MVSHRVLNFLVFLLRRPLQVLYLVGSSELNTNLYPITYMLDCFLLLTRLICCNSVTKSRLVNLQIISLYHLINDQLVG